MIQKFTKTFVYRRHFAYYCTENKFIFHKKCPCLSCNYKLRDTFLFDTKTTKNVRSIVKYLLEDVKLAKILLSAIIEEDIISLELRPQELIIDVPEKYLSILRVDFKAIIRTPDGKTKKILIEMQKSRVLFDIMRFRKYLADNYGREDEIISHEGNKTEVLPITTIYFLNFKLKNIKFPVLKIDRIYNNVITKKSTKVKENFIEQLTHDCYAIQIPRLQLNMQNKLEKLLSIFNQTYVTNKDRKVLNLPPEWEEDEILRLFIEKMNKPLLNHDMIRKAEIEDEIDKIFEKVDRDLLEAQQKLYKAEKQKDEAEKQKDEAEKQKDEAEKQKDEAKKQKDEAEKQKDEAEKQKDEAKNALLKLQQNQDNAIENLLTLNLTVEQISKSLQVSVEKVLEIKKEI